MKHVQRAQIILLSAERLPVLEIAKRVGISRPMVWRWQQRFAEEGIEGLLRDKTRPPGIPPVPRPRCRECQILVRRAIVAAKEREYGDQEGHPGRTFVGARPEGWCFRRTGFSMS